MFETRIQGLDQVHYKDPDDIAQELGAAKIIVIVFKADATEVLAECARTAAERSNN